MRGAGGVGGDGRSRKNDDGVIPVAVVVKRAVVRVWMGFIFAILCTISWIQRCSNGACSEVR